MPFIQLTALFQQIIPNGDNRSTLSVVLVFAIALAVSGFSIPWVKQMALALGFVDAPSKRKLHTTPMPLMGGVAIFGGAILILLVYFWQLGNNRVLGVLFATLVILIVGLIDDRYQLPAPIKLGGELIAFAIVAFLGTRTYLPVPLFVNYLLTFIWFGAMTNAINFLDNMDGLCGGVSAVAAGFVLLLASLNGQYLIAPIAAAVFGACLGFLRYNFKPASIFMGDAGSLFLGFILSYMTLQLNFENQNIVTWMVPLFILIVPVFDLTLVFISRLRRKVNPLTTAGKDHTSHRLVRMGYSQREAVLFLYLLGGAGGMIAIFITQATRFEAYLIGGVVVVAAVYAIVQLEKWRA